MHSVRRLDSTSWRKPINKTHKRKREMRARAIFTNPVGKIGVIGIAVLTEKRYESWAWMSYER